MRKHFAAIGYFLLGVVTVCVVIPLASIAVVFYDLYQLGRGTHDMFRE